MSPRPKRLSLPLRAGVRGPLFTGSLVIVAALAAAGCGSSASRSAYHPPDPNAITSSLFRLQLQTQVHHQAAKLGISSTQVTGVVDCMISQFQTEGLNKVTSVVAKHAAAERQALDQCVQQVKGAAGASGSSGSGGSGGSGSSGASGSSGSSAGASGASGASGSSAGAGASGSSG